MRELSFHYAPQHVEIRILAPNTPPQLLRRNLIQHIVWGEESASSNLRAHYFKRDFAIIDLSCSDLCCRGENPTFHPVIAMNILVEVAEILVDCFNGQFLHFSIAGVRWIFTIRPGLAITQSWQITKSGLIVISCLVELLEFSDDIH